ncbi:hypothetical protein [Virgibacillus salexigens]|uniref:Uncharacterized protein n=1 Tax=Virgibacillus kapii TaxID=1638645 RepID=A0ABQ2DQK7_9BACI|nr:hypothetical protein [Virgibacillus kapii]GGJ67616.1 hypothetical protein GCM10007111_31860 [Virgibacillus kapii]
MAKILQEMMGHSDSYEMINERTIKKYNHENKMWVTMKFNDEKNNDDGINRFKELLRQNFIDSFS